MLANKVLNNLGKVTYIDVFKSAGRESQGHGSLLNKELAKITALYYLCHRVDKGHVFSLSREWCQRWSYANTVYGCFGFVCASSLSLPGVSRHQLVATAVVQIRE